MTTSVYPIHRLINRPMTIKGLKGQYILIAAGALIGDLFLFIILYCCKVPPWICIGIAFGLGAAALSTAFRMSQRYGVHGWKKKRARRRAPDYLRCRSRRLFTL
jgi:Domain of unknown function (DUF4133)